MRGFITLNHIGERQRKITLNVAHVTSVDEAFHGTCVMTVAKEPFYVVESREEILQMMEDAQEKKLAK